MLTERNRAVLHRRLTELVRDEEAVSEMLSNFSNDPTHVPASEAFVERRLAQQTAVLIMWMIGLFVAASAVVRTGVGLLT